MGKRNEFVHIFVILFVLFESITVRALQYFKQMCFYRIYATKPGFIHELKNFKKILESLDED
ncbi:MAG: hypothetical protein ACPLPS_10500, partial [bacterium]